MGLLTEVNRVLLPAHIPHDSTASSEQGGFRFCLGNPAGIDLIEQFKRFLRHPTFPVVATAVDSTPRVMLLTKLCGAADCLPVMVGASNLRGEEPLAASG
ncbi:hypothetical protein E8E95_01320 [Pseudomonas sp. BN414]|nr:hypothetical protein [Pseudomonas sp. BN414]